MASAQRILRFLAGRFRDTQSDGKVYALQNGALLDVTNITQKALSTVPLTVTSAGQTQFTVPGGYTPGLLQVARNGILQSFTGTDGSTITLSSGTSSTSDTVTAYVFATFQVANALMLSGGTLTGQLTAPTVNMTGSFNAASIVTLASAATVNIGAAAANDLTITGTTTITAFDTVASGVVKRLTFSGALTLTHNATSLILPAAANVVTMAGDAVTFLSLGGGNWRCVGYARANGSAVFPASNPNLLVNSTFAFNQRVFNGGALAAGSYGHDRWGAYNGGCNYSVSSGVVTLVSGTLCQVIESPALAGMVVTISVENPSAAVSVIIGSTSGVIPAGSGRIGVTLTVPSDQTGNLKVRFSGSNASFSKPKFELGRQATQASPPDQALERARCLRYYEKSYVDSDAPGTTTTSGYINWFMPGAIQAFSYNTTFSQQKRGVPALVIYSITGAANKVYDVANSVDTDARPTVGVNGFRNYFVPASGTAINLGHHYIADAELACTD